ncbi:MAG: DNA topoisomerase, partial [Clostridium sp.]
MSKQFVLAEKPSVGREIGRVLGCNIKKDGYLEGKQYVVSWALGHLVELAEPQEYDARYETWNMEDLPMLPKYMKTKVIPKTSKQFKLVKTLMQRKDINEIIIATDAGREGELVARWIIEKANVQKSMKRLWISSQTDKAIKDGFAHLKDAKDYENLYYSAKCRAEADWLVGLNTTRALTCKYNAQLSAGRVQTPTLAMIVDKEEEIRKFVPKEYFTIHINTREFTLEYRNQANNAIYDKQKAEQIQHELRNQAVTIVNVETKAGKELPPQLYDLTELQRDANLRYGFSAKETLNYIQDLYEIHKVLTYPRTDSRYLSSDIVPTLKDRLKAIAIDEYEPYVQSILKKDIRISKRVVDDTKVSDHHAIIPTEEFVE